MAPKSQTRRSYSDRTLKLLWGRSAGHCAMPDCRIELFADETQYDPVVVIGEMGHVAAAGAKGPRADASMSTEVKNDYDNLILLCQNCHGKIDGQPGFYTVAKLLDIKQAHEAWVRASLPERGRSRTGWTGLGLEGDQPLDLGTVDAALSPDFTVGTTTRITVPTNPAEWSAVLAQISNSASAALAGGDRFEKRLAIFPLAPVTACIALGFFLTSRPNVRHFQLHRDTQSWAWPKIPAPANDITVTRPEMAQKGADQVGFRFHLSAEVTDAAVHAVIPAATPTFDIRAPVPDTGWLISPQQIIWVAAAAREAFAAALRHFPEARLWHIFYAGPAPIAVSVGQQLNPTMCPTVQLYEFKFRESPQYKASVRLG